MAFGIITGTALYNIPNLELKERNFQTQYGDVQVFTSSEIKPSLVFIPRHGINHSVPPHKINYRANIMAMKMLGVTKIVAAYAVGSINLDIPPLSLVAIDDFMDFTTGRQHTFYDGLNGTVDHVDVSDAYDPILRIHLLKSAEEAKIHVRPNGVYVCTNGPRLESPAEIRMYKNLGADVVGMTGVPEVTLAKELNIPFAALAFSVNWAAGIEKSVQFQQEGLSQLTSKILSLLIKTAIRSEE